MLAPMRVLAGHHVSFAVRDLERARRFYEGVLGFEPIPRPAFPFPGAWYRVGPIEVHLIVVPEGVETGTPAPRLTPVTNHAAFAVDDYDATVRHLEAQGIEFLGLGPKQGQVFVRDEDGNLIELLVADGRIQRAWSERSS